MNSGLFLSFSDLATFTTATQAEIAAYLKGRLPEAAFERGEGDNESDGDGIPARKRPEWKPTDLSINEARQFINRLDEKVRIALNVMVEASPDGFLVNDVCAKLGIAIEDQHAALKSVWGAMTRRARKVSGDREAYLFEWTERKENDWIGKISPTTHGSLRTVLGIAAQLNR
ncbi:hypothetical protein UAJ10_02235 [Nitrospirillum sp. BR 11164]|uniref:hypothetical protein n=1 Tax=Nitrospirillum sp. BR 11164 TaxID=3104324 RepID=UPI002AFEAF45|nr:hypothetical protein [Nitrospirillum sp. BR 11164]MEA1647838.1 hypothetical protein [Nitrospirillum sp. BR 11164]